MAWPEGKRILVCGRVDDEQATPAIGSDLGLCDDCGSVVWMSPVSQRERSARLTPVVCVQCYDRHETNHPGSTILIRQRGET